MIKKGTKLYSIVKRKCPICQEGDFFEDNNPYNLKSMSQVLKSCPICKSSYHMEPGFYYGAMYVAYSIGVALMVSIWVTTAILPIDFSFWVIVYILGGILIIFSPIIYAFSKIIWANLFYKYKGLPSGKK